MEVTRAFTSRGNLDSPVSSACFGFSQSVYSEIRSLCLLERSEAHPLCPMTNGWSGNTWKICVHKSKKIFFCLTVEQNQGICRASGEVSPALGVSKHLQLKRSETAHERGCLLALSTRDTHPGETQNSEQRCLTPDHRVHRSPSADLSFGAASHLTSKP